MEHDVKLCLSGTFYRALCSNMKDADGPPFEF